MIFVKIDPEKEKNRYRIYKEIQLYGKSIVEDASKKEWYPGVSRKIGMDAQKMKHDNEYTVLPPTFNRWKDIAVFTTNNKIVLDEISKGTKHLFIPRKINL